MFYQRIGIYISLILLLNLTAFRADAQNLNAVIAKLSESLGTNSLKEAPYIMFSCNSIKHPAIQGEHSFLYDWNNKNCRFEGETKGGQELIVLFNAERKTGKVFIEKKQAENPELLKSVMQLFEHDSFFLFTPLRITDQILASSLQETEIVDAKKYFVLKVNSPSAAFESSLLFIDSQSGNLSLWKTYNKNQNKTHEFTVSRIKDAGGGLTLPTLFTDKMSGKVYQYPIVAALVNIEESKFKTP